MPETSYNPSPKRSRNRSPNTNYWKRSYTAGIPAAHCPDIPSDCRIEQAYVRKGGRQQITLYQHRENDTYYLRQVDRGTDGVVDSFETIAAAERAIDELKTELEDKYE